MAGELIPPNDIQFKRLEKRKLGKDVCELYGYGCAKYQDSPVHVAPYYHRGSLVAQHLRYPDKMFKWLGKAKKLELFGQRVFPSDSNRRLVLTEGEIDALSVCQAFNLKMPVVSIPSGVGSASQAVLDNLEYLNSFEEIILAFDNDDVGIDAQQKVLPLFRPGTVKLFNYPDGIKDPNELLIKGQAQRIVEAVIRANTYTPAGIVSGTTIFEDIIASDESGLGTPYPALDQKLLGFRKGELYLFTAGSGVGKTTLVNEIAYHFLTKHNQKLGVISLEENKKRLGRRYLSLYLDKPLHISMKDVTQSQLEEAFKATVGSERFWLFDHWGSHNLDGLIGKLRYMAVGLQVDWIILDHISIVVSGLDEIEESERKLIDRLMTRLRSLIEETGVGVLAIVHLKRAESGSKTWNEGKQVRLTDLRGSGGLEQLSDVVIALERDQQGNKADVSTIRVLKNRPIGRLGIADTLLYNHDTGRLLPCEEAFVENGDF